MNKLKALLVFAVILSVSCTQTVDEPDKASVKGEAKPGYQKFIVKVAQDIEGIKKDYAQLAEFSIEKHCDPDELKIRYGYKTHRSKRRGGWTAGVPNPDDDGIWFYIDLHDPDSTRQIHTQPATIKPYYRDKRVMFLILEGKKTKKARGKLYEILKNNGAAGGILAGHS